MLTKQRLITMPIIYRKPLNVCSRSKFKTVNGPRENGRLERCRAHAHSLTHTRTLAHSLVRKRLNFLLINTFWRHINNVPIHGKVRTNVASSTLINCLN